MFVVLTGKLSPKEARIHLAAPLMVTGKRISRFINTLVDCLHPNELKK